MKEHPILFFCEMVRAIIEVRMVQTRRVISHKSVQPESEIIRHTDPLLWQVFNGRTGNLPDIIKCPYGKPGDRLWVRETWNEYECREDGYDDDFKVAVCYKASYDEQLDGSAEMQGAVKWYEVDEIIFDKFFHKIEQYEICGDKWHPSIHMPRWASRITLEVTNVRVERVQSISEEDAIAEGIEWRESSYCDDAQDYWRDYPVPDSRKWADFGFFEGDPIASFHTLWDSIYAARGYGWDTNPLVWVIEFRREVTK